ncbi:protein broad-minded-like isoform X2 [Liolophura sinensis]|uniref:protein broad-minded-like isoform X2 n=1 Tax=Liolophura sinensis TaxID=3198878 RepID=UPI003158AA15
MMEGEELVNNLKHLVLGFEPHVREAGSLEQVEDVLQHLEENEQHFHRYEFVKQLKRSIEENLGGFIDEEIEKCSMGVPEEVGQDETQVDRITERVIHSSPMSELVGKLKRAVTEAAEDLLQNFGRQFESAVHNGESSQETSRPRKHYPDDDETSYSSSLNQPGSFMFMNTDRFVRLTEDLEKGQPPEIRREALRQLNMIPATEIVCSDQWHQVKSSVLDLLADPDQNLANSTLKFIMQAFSTTTPRTGEIFTLLVKFLSSQMTSHKSTAISSLKSGLDLRKVESVRLLKAFRLMNEFQREAPGYWVRYPEKYMEEILQSTLDLLSLETAQVVSPSHLIAVLDPKASWFIKWMHGSYSRLPVLTMLQRYPSILENAVRHCLRYCSSRRCSSDRMSDTSENAPWTSSLTGQRMVYTGAELEYAYFIHSVHFLGSLLSYTRGRDFFPVKLPDRTEPLTISNLLVAMISLITDPDTPTASPATEDWCPPHLLTQTLKVLCSTEEVCEICLCKDSITNALLTPLEQWLEPQSDISSAQLPSEGTLLRVADILSVIASSTRGRRHLLYGQDRTLLSRNESSAARVITEFTTKALDNKLTPGFAEPPSKAVIGDCLYICRQLYNTYEGLLILSHYSLHSCVAQAFHQACLEAEKAPTPTPGPSDDRRGRSNGQSALVWEDTLRDNLLNFASTAKGILLLQQTGSLNECVSYMSARYAKKLQVSKREKFGYGYMVTQVATTAPGMVALLNSGFIQALIHELWSVLECGLSDQPVLAPRIWPVDPIDRPSHKPLIRLLNVLTSFPAVYEALADQRVTVQEFYSLRQMPDTVASLIDRLVMVNTPAKIHSLFNYEQSHVCGLRILSVMISCLDTQLLLQSQYHYQEALLVSQGENTPQPRLVTGDGRPSKDRNDIIIDMLTVERNYILIKSYLIGGPSERVLPPRCLSQGKGELYPYPLFTSYPVPREYTPNLTGRSAMKQATSSNVFLPKDNDLSKLLAENKKKPEKNSDQWLDKCRAAMLTVLSSKPDLTKGNTVQYLMEQSVVALSNTKDAIFRQVEVSASEKAVRSYKLTSLQQLGITLAIRYGTHLKLLSSNSDATSSLTQLLKLTGSYLHQQQKETGSSLRYLTRTYQGFDWFVATVFLIFNGSLERSWKFLQKFSTLASSGFLWSCRLHASVHVAPELMLSGIPPVFSSTGHNIELVLHTELPLIASAFKMSGYTPAQICCHWLRQCFWNYLDWVDICHYLCVIMVMGVDYQVYVCVAILRHLQSDISRHMQDQDLVIFLKEEPIRGFRLGHHLPYMKTLEEKFRTIILSDMLNFSKP